MYKTKIPQLRKAPPDNWNDEKNRIDLFKSRSSYPNDQIEKKKKIFCTKTDVHHLHVRIEKQVTNVNELKRTKRSIDVKQFFFSFLFCSNKCLFKMCSPWTIRKNSSRTDGKGRKGEISFIHSSFKARLNSFLRFLTLTQWTNEID